MRIGIYKPKVLFIKTDTMTSINFAVCDNCEYLIDFLRLRLLFKYRFAMLDGNSESVIVFFYVGIQEYICLIYCVYTRQFQFQSEAGLQSLKVAFYSPFGLWDAACFYVNPKPTTCIAELRKGIIFRGRIFYLLILKYGASVCKEHGRNTISG